MKKYKVTSLLSNASSYTFSFKGYRKYDFEPKGSAIVTNEEDVKAFKKDKNYIVREIKNKEGEEKV